MSIKIVKGDASDGGYTLERNIHITWRELEILALVGMGLSNEEAAKKLSVSINTVRNHVYNIAKKLDANDRANAIVRAVEKGMFNILDETEDAFDLAGGYTWCLICEQVSRGHDIKEVRPKPIEIDHVFLEPPPEYECTNQKCKADLSLFGKPWSKVRMFHPEYPKIPKLGTNYDCTEILEAETKGISAEEYHDIILNTEEPPDIPNVEWDNV